MASRIAKLAWIVSLAGSALACGGPETSTTAPTASERPSTSTNSALATTAAAVASPGFAVLANAAATCTNGTIAGSVGTFLATPTGSITKTACPVTGSLDVGDAASIAAFKAFSASYAALAPKAGDVCKSLTGTLDGVILAPGTYCFSGAAVLTGVLTLRGPASGVWIFKIGSGVPPTGALTGTNFTVVMAGGGQACNVTWWVAQAATLTTSAFKGNLLTGAAVTATGGAIAGNLYSKADVTITGTAVTGCASVALGGGGGSGDDQGDDCDGEGHGHSDEGRGHGGDGKGHGDGCEGHDGHQGHADQDGEDHDGESHHGR